MNLLSNQAPACPWFRKESLGCIECDGLTEDSTIQFWLPEEDKKEHLRIFCCNNWRNCELYTAIAQQYPGLAIDKPTLVQAVNGIAENNDALRQVLERQRKILEKLSGLTEEEEE